MQEFLLQRSTVIALALIGGALSLLVSWLSAREVLSPATLALLNKAAYAFMGVSIFLFIAVGITKL